MSSNAYITELMLDLKYGCTASGHTMVLPGLLSVGVVPKALARLGQRIAVYIGIFLYGSWLLLPHNRLEKPQPLKLLLWLVLILICALSLSVLILTKSEKVEKIEEHSDAHDE